MKKIFFILFIALNYSYINSNAQNIINSDSSKMPNDQLVINLLSNTWLNSPANMKLMPVSIGSEVYFMTPVIGKYSTFSIAIGAGVGVNNIHNNALPYDSLEITNFKPVPGGYEYEKNKITTAYVDVPLEIRFRTQPNIKKRNFKVALGGKFGYLISSYMKYSGQDFRALSNKHVKFKEYWLNNIIPYRYTVFLRAGYGKISFILNYTLSPLFEKGKGPDVIPVSFGFSFTLL